MRLRGLYAITNGTSAPQLLERVAAAIAGGAAMVQYRDKGTDATRAGQDAQVQWAAAPGILPPVTLVLPCTSQGCARTAREREARDLLAVCRAHGVSLIINDDVALAATVGADGVHLGRDDAAVREARRVLGAAAIIGVSCYNDFELAVAAQQAGASYVAFGRFFLSHTKPDAVAAPLDLIRQAKAQLSIPVVAIGGITPDNAAPLIDAGVDMLAVIHGIFGQADPEQAARRYTQLFEHLRNQP